MFASSNCRFVVSACLLLASASVLPADPLPPGDLAALSPEVRPAVVAAQAEVAALGAASPPAARAEAWGRLGMIYLHERLLDAAEPCFATARAAQPEQMRWAYYLAVAQQQKGDLKSAAASLRQAMAVREGNLPVALRLAGILAELGEPAAAEELYTAALESPYGAAGAWAGLGRLALARGDAKRRSKRSKRRSPPSPKRAPCTTS